jgi:hypothetical protein
MILTCALLIVLTSCPSVVAAAPAVVTQDPRTSVETAIPEGIRLLEAKDYATFLRLFVPPDVLKELSAAESFEGFAKTFGEDGKATAVLAALKSIRGTKPAIDGDGRRATFTLKVPTEGKTTITFIKIGEFWYISDNQP